MLMVMVMERRVDKGETIASVTDAVKGQGEGSEMAEVMD